MNRTKNNTLNPISSLQNGNRMANGRATFALVGLLVFLTALCEHGVTGRELSKTSGPALFYETEPKAADGGIMETPEGSRNLGRKNRSERKKEKKEKEAAREKAKEEAAQARHEKYCAEKAAREKQFLEDEANRESIFQARSKKKNRHVLPRERSKTSRSRARKRLQDRRRRNHRHTRTHRPKRACPTVAPTTAPAETTVAPTTAPSTATTTIEECVDNRQDIAISVDVQIQWPDDGFAACDNDVQGSSINTNIQAALNEEFAARVPDWQGAAVFGEFVFDPAQEIDNVDPVATRRLAGQKGRAGGGLRASNSRQLQEGTCPTRDVDCTANDGDYCRWGCVTAATTDCGDPASTTDNWTNLAEDIRLRLAGLAYPCLGTPDLLKVVVTVVA